MKRGASERAGCPGAHHYHCPCCGSWSIHLEHSFGCLMGFHCCTCRFRAWLKKPRGWAFAKEY